MGWRTLMQADSPPSEEIQEHGKTVSKVSKGTKEVPDRADQGGFGAFDTLTERSQKPIMAESVPYSPGDRVMYRAPVIVRAPREYTWQEYTGVVLAVSELDEMVLIEPQDTQELSWRWIWWGYVERANDAQA